MKKEKLLNYLFLLFPLIDFITAIATWENWPSIGVAVRSIFLVYVFLHLLKKGKEKKFLWVILGLLSFYTVINMGFWYFERDRNLYLELSNIIKIFYLPLMIIYFKEEENKINTQTISKILLCYLLLYLLPYPFHLGHNMNEIYPNKDLYLSYFYIGNELANVFILLTPIVLYTMIKEKNKYLPFYVILILLMIHLLGTKALYASILLIVCFFLYQQKEKIFPIIKKHLPWFAGLMGIFLGFLIIWLPKSDFYQNIQTTLEFYNIHQITDLFTIENIDHVLFSDRLTNLSRVAEVYHKSPLKNKILGIGRTKLLSIKDIEIDGFDIYYSIGFLGFLVYVICMIYAIRRSSLKPLYQFLLILMILLSCITGHVLLSPMISTYLALLFSINQEKKKIES